MIKQEDKQILKELKQHPQHGMELLMEAYTGLIWKVISFHLKNPEDIKECVNDTFAQFYFHRNSFDASKASLSIYLTAIARNISISRYRREKKHSLDSMLSDVSTEDSALLLAETQADLARALSALKPNELQIIRMKYYGGMTIAEIAESLDLPYETVKKRHQRSLSKLRHSLFLTLLLLLILLFSLCTYAVLRHFNLIPPLFSTEEIKLPAEDEDSDVPTTHLPSTDTTEGENESEHQTETMISKNEESQEIDTITIDGPQISSRAQKDYTSDNLSKDVPQYYTYISGYGIKEVSDTPAYTLSSVVYAEDDATRISVTQASLIDNHLNITITALSKTKPFSIDPSEWDEKLGQDVMRHPDGSTHKLYYHGAALLCGGGSVSNSENHYMETTYFETDNFETLDSDKDRIPFTVHCYDLDISFSLIPATEEKITDNNIYQMKEYGGLLIIPRLEDGSLKIAIHPLNRGELITLPGLIRGPIGEKYDDGIITATDQDGNTLTGTCIRYYPGSTFNYFEWDFGKASPGSYSLHIPFLFQIPTTGEEFSIPVNFTDQTWETKKYDVTGGKIWVSNITDPYELDKCNDRYTRYENAIKYWGTADYPNSFLDNPDNYIYQNLTLSGEANDEQHQIAGIYGQIKSDCCPGIEAIDDAVTEELSSDVSSQTSTYLVSFLRGYKDPSTAQFRVVARKKSSYIHTPVYYRWNESFDFTFTIE